MPLPPTLPLRPRACAARAGSTMAGAERGSVAAVLVAEAVDATLALRPCRSKPICCVAGAELREAAERRGVSIRVK